MGAIALSPTNIVNNQLTYDKDNTYISMSKYEESPEIMIKRGDVIFVKTGSTVGKVAYVDKMICKTTLNPQVVVLKDIKCDNYILSVIMSTRNFQNKIQRITVGGAVPTLSQVAMGNIFISLPAAKEQEKISKFISLLDERIATQNKIIDKLQTLIKGINKHVFTSNGINYKLEELCEIRSGYSGNQLTSKRGLKVSRIETISGHKVNMERVGYVAPFESSENYRLQVGDILFSNINSVEYIGNTAFIDKDYNLYHGMNLLRLIPNDKVVIPFYLYLLLNTNKILNRFKTICNKAVSQASINQTELGKIVIQIPDINAQKQICELYQALYAQLESEKYANSLFQNQKQYLLRQMFI